jgi:hypothetical protein
MQLVGGELIHRSAGRALSMPATSCTGGGPGTQRELKHGSGRQIGLGPSVAAVLLRHYAHERQPQARAAWLRAAAMHSAREALEQRRLALRLDTGPLIRDGYHAVVVAQSATELDASNDVCRGCSR